MSIISRRDFLIGLAAVATSCSVAGKASMAALPQVVKTPALSPDLSGRLSAISYLGPKKSSIFSFDLQSGKIDQATLDLDHGHDALKIGDMYLAIPKSTEPAYAINFDGERKKISMPSNISFSGHGLYDQEHNRVIATAYDFADRLAGYFIIINTKNFEIEEMIPNDCYQPHDIRFFDDDTIALCAYNVLQPYGLHDYGLTLRPDDDHSQIVLYDRKTLKPKQFIDAYRDAVVSHLVVTKEKQIFATGNQEFKDDNIRERSVEYWQKNLKDYFLKSQPELKSQYLDIISHIRPHKVEKINKELGLPLPNLYLPYGADKVQQITANPQFHRRAQSICYNENSNIVGISYPNTDGVLLVNAQTQAVSSLSISDTGLPEVRGITAIEDSPYMVVAGHKKDFAVIDSVTAKVVKTYEADIGRTIHIHHDVS